VSKLKIKMVPVRNEAQHDDLESFAGVPNGATNPQMQYLYKMGIVGLTLVCVQN
jgi:hypothetical protein